MNSDKEITPPSIDGAGPAIDYTDLILRTFELSNESESTLDRDAYYYDFFCAIEHAPGFIFDVQLKPDVDTILQLVLNSYSSMPKLIEKLLSYPWISKEYLEHEGSNAALLSHLFAYHTEEIIEMVLDKGATPPGLTDMRTPPVVAYISKLNSRQQLESTLCQRLIELYDLKNKPLVINNLLVRAMRVDGYLEQVMFLIELGKINIDTYKANVGGLNEFFLGIRPHSELSLLRLALRSNGVQLAIYFINAFSDKEMVLDEIKEAVKDLSTCSPTGKLQQVNDKIKLLQQQATIISDKLSLERELSTPAQNTALNLNLNQKQNKI